jgi:hypothetical protein
MISTFGRLKQFGLPLPLRPEQRLACGISLPYVLCLGEMNLEFGRSNIPQPKAEKWLTGGSQTIVLLQLRSSLHYFPNAIPQLCKIFKTIRCHRTQLRIFITL